MGIVLFSQNHIEQLNDIGMLDVLKQRQLSNRSDGELQRYLEGSNRLITPSFSCSSLTFLRATKMPWVVMARKTDLSTR